MLTGGPMINTYNLSKSYKDTVAVDKVNLSIEKGEIFGLLGPNGAGKTTVVSMLCTLLQPSNGTATISGFDILTYHGFSYIFYANNIPSLIKRELDAPDKIMAYLLKNRHLAPTHTSVQYFPFEKDGLLIAEKVQKMIVFANRVAQVNAIHMS